MTMKKNHSKRRLVLQERNNNESVIIDIMIQCTRTVLGLIFRTYLLLNWRSKIVSYVISNIYTTHFQTPLLFGSLGKISGDEILP